ncbi:MAG: hypothetical protein WBQ82_09025 [Methyloceanibacter sp.]|jgi:hypothetical protein
MQKVIRRHTLLSGVLLGAMGLAAPAQASMLGLLPYEPELPVIKVLGCRVHGLGIVCGPAVALPRLRKKTYHKEQVEPSYKDQSEETPSSKGGTASQKGSSTATNGSQKDTADQSTVQGGDAGVHACPPGNVVLEKPNASGSFCEPAADQSSGSESDQSAAPAQSMDKATDKATSSTPQATP